MVGEGPRGSSGSLHSRIEAQLEERHSIGDPICCILPTNDTVVGIEVFSLRDHAALKHAPTIGLAGGLLAVPCRLPVTNTRSESGLFS